MPFKDLEKRREAAREWAARRRREWLAGQRCRDCGAADGLHIFGAKSKGASAFTCSEARRAELLADAFVLCDACVGQEREGRASARAKRKNQRRRKPTVEVGASVERQPRLATEPARPERSSSSTGPKPRARKAHPTPMPESPLMIESRQRRKEWREARRRELGYGQTE